jgi:hypothetical protein
MIAAERALKIGAENFDTFRCRAIISRCTAYTAGTRCGPWYRRACFPMPLGGSPPRCPRSFNNVLACNACVQSLTDFADILAAAVAHLLAIRHDNIQKLSVTGEHCSQLSDQVLCLNSIVSSIQERW